jgi:hypothetical protein
MTTSCEHARLRCWPNGLTAMADRGEWMITTLRQHDDPARPEHLYGPTLLRLPRHPPVLVILARGAEQAFTFLTAQRALSQIRPMRASRARCDCASLLWIGDSALTTAVDLNTPTEREKAGKSAARDDMLLSCRIGHP